MYRKVIRPRLLVLAVLVWAAAFNVRAAIITYEVTGTLVPVTQTTSFYALYAVDDGELGKIPFSSRIEVDSSVAPQVIFRLPGVFERVVFPDVIRSVALQIGPHQFHTTRTLWDDPRVEGAGDLDESLMRIERTSADSFALIVADQSSRSAGTQDRPSSRLFNDVETDINADFGLVQYTRLGIRVDGIALGVTGVQLASSRRVPGEDLSGEFEIPDGSFSVEATIAALGTNGAIYAPNGGRGTFVSSDMTIRVSAVPEPGAFAMTVAGLVLVASRWARVACGQRRRGRFT